MTTKNWLILCAVGGAWIGNVLTFMYFAFHTTLEGGALYVAASVWELGIGAHAVLVLLCARME